MIALLTHGNVVSGTSWDFVANDLTALHHKLYLLQFGNILQRVAGNGDDICKLPFLKRTNAILPTHHLRRHGGRRLYSLARRHSILDKIGEFGRLRPVGKWTNAAAKGDFHPAGNSQTATFLPQCLEAVFAARRLGIPRGVLAEGVVVGRKFQVDTSFLHQVSRCFVQFDGMLDGVHAGLDTIAQTFSPERMACRPFAMPVRLVHDSLHFFLRKSGVTSQRAVGFKFVFGSRVELDPVRAIVNLFANGLPRGPRPIHGLIVSWQAYFRRAQNTLACCDQAHGRNLHSRPYEVTSINRPLDVHVSVAAAVAHQVAQGGEARPQILLRVGKCEQRSILARIIDWACKGRPPWLDAVEPKAKNVRVSVNQSRQNRGFAKVNNVRARWNL